MAIMQKLQRLGFNYRQTGEEGRREKTEKVREKGRIRADIFPALCARDRQRQREREAGDGEETTGTKEKKK